MNILRNRTKHKNGLVRNKISYGNSILNAGLQFQVGIDLCWSCLCYFSVVSQSEVNAIHVSWKRPGAVCLCFFEEYRQINVGI